MEDSKRQGEVGDGVRAACRAFGDCPGIWTAWASCGEGHDIRANGPKSRGDGQVRRIGEEK